jgi:hypothetical protein
MAKQDNKTDKNLSEITEQPAQIARLSEHGRFRYTGATLPKGRLKHGTVYIGTREQVLAYFKREIDSGACSARDFMPAITAAQAGLKGGKNG